MRALKIFQLLLHLAIIVFGNTDYPCFTNWVYSKVSGKCYLFFSDTLDYQSAYQKCASQLSQFPISAYKIGLSKILSKADADGMMTELINQGNNARLWLDCTYNGSVFIWNNGGIVNTTALSSMVTTSDFSNPCLQISYTFIMSSSGSVLQSVITSRPCNESASYLCQHTANICDPNNLPLYSGDIMTLVPSSSNVAMRPYVSCRTGYYRVSDLQPAPTGSPVPIPLNYANCTGSQSPDFNPFIYQANWVLNNTQTTLEVCLSVSCPFFNGTLRNVQSQIVMTPEQVLTSYNFGYTFPVTCLKGFVNFLDKTTPKAAVVCQQSIFQKQIGVWSPESNIPCVSVTCNLTLLLNMVPRNGMLLSARNRASQQQYNVNLQQSSLSLYDNIITIQCNEGYFFSDRTYQKSVICGLQNNSLVNGQWQGYLGTSIPLDPNCQVATCTYEAIVITPKLNLQTTFYVMDSNGIYQTFNQTSLNPYVYNTKIRFLCLNGYSSVNQQPDQNLTCGPQGVWIPNLTPCIQVTAQLNLGNNLHYIPTPVESQNAKNVGYVVILILIIFISLIIILDVSTISRDARTMRTNIKNLKRFINRNKS